MKSKLIFDVTDANTIADSDSIGAFIRASDGSLIAHTSNALNVHIASGASSGTEFAEDSAHTTGDLGTQILAVRNDIEGSLVSANGDYASLQLDASGRLRTLSAITGTVDVSGSTVTIQEPLSIDDNGSSITVDAVDLDIRNLVFATDKVDASGSTLGANDGVDIGDVTINNAAGASAVNIQDGGNSITVDAINLDIRDLNFATDSVTSRTQDGSGNAITSTAGSLDVNVTSENDDALANTAIKANAVTLTVSGTAQNVVATALTNRKYLYIYNNDNRTAFIGETGATDLTVTGYPVDPSVSMMLRAGAAVNIEFDSNKTGHELRTMELS